MEKISNFLKTPIQPQDGLLWVLLGLGLWFRIIHLDQPVYWVDEVATSIRVAGYTRADVIHHLSTGQLFSVSDLLHFQQLSRDRPWSDTLHALMQSPEHAPLYFLLARLWAQIWGSSVEAMRSLSVVCSGLAGLAMAWLGRLLFSGSVGRVAMALMAISPFFVAYAQEARPYSLWILMLLLLNGTLWRSLTQSSRWAWLSYSVVLGLSLYTSLLTIWVVLGQGLAVMGTQRSQWRAYAIATGLGFIAFLPWIGVIVTHWQTLQENTGWMRTPIPVWATLAIWCYTLAVLFFDVPVSVDFSLATIAKVLISTGLLAFMGYSMYRFICQTPRSLHIFLLSGLASTPLVLFILDSIRQGQSAATPRYLMPLQLGMILILARELGCVWDTCRSQRWRSLVLGSLIGLSLVSGWIGLSHTSDYQKARNRANPAIAAWVNASPHPILMAEPRLSLDLLSLSHDLNAETRIQVLSTAQFLTQSNSTTCQPRFVLNPSPELQTHLPIALVYRPELLTPQDIHLSLWRMQPPSHCDDTRSRHG